MLRKDPVLWAFLACSRHGIEEEPALQDTLAYFIESGGGIWPERYAEPLRYKKKRKYIRGLALDNEASGSQSLLLVFEFLQ